MSHLSMKVKGLVTGLCALTLTTVAQAQLLTSTGQISSGGLDSRWQISTDGGGAWTAASLVPSPPSVWATVPSGSWIAATSSGSLGGGSYRARQQFTLNAGDVLSFSMQCAVDNSLIGLFVNGTLVSGPTCGAFAFGAPMAFTMANFTTGLNTLEIRWTGDNTTDGVGVAISSLVYNPGAPPNPNVVPEPSTYALMATGLIGLVGIGRRRRTR